jgi:hypothetical protein
MNDHTIVDNADDEVEFAIKMTVMLRTATRAADELAMSYRELAHRFAKQVDADLASDVDPLGLPITLASREVSQQGQAILATLYKQRTASDPTAGPAIRSRDRTGGHTGPVQALSPPARLGS